MLAVIDYGAGNLRSVLHALNHLGAQDVHIVRTPQDLAGAHKIILPGVGAFGAGMQQLHEQGLVDAIRTATAAGTPYLGICLGMQFLFDFSEEMGTNAGLGILKGKVTRFPTRPHLKVPHMGWNTININKPSPVFTDLSEPASVYFVHSYYCTPDDPQDTTATVTYGDKICVAVQRDNVYGVQFHPEKSQKTGLRILQNYLNLP